MDLAGPIPMGPPDASTCVSILFVSLLDCTLVRRAGGFTVLAASSPPRATTTWDLVCLCFCSHALHPKPAQEMPLLPDS